MKNAADPSRLLLPIFVLPIFRPTIAANASLKLTIRIAGIAILFSNNNTVKAMPIKAFAAPVKRVASSFLTTSPKNR